MNPGLIKTFEAGADIGANRIVTLNSQGKVIAATDLSVMPIGVVQTACNSGDRVDVAMSGIVDVYANGSVSPGSPIGAGAAGAGGVAEGYAQQCGIALESASNGEIFSMLIAIQHGAAEMCEYLTLIRQAGGDIVSHRIVAIDNGEFKQATSGTAVLVGVATEDIDDEAEGAMIVSGIATVTAGGSVSVGNYITSDTNGKGVVATATDNVVAVALESASADEDFEALVVHNYVRTAAST